MMLPGQRAVYATVAKRLYFPMVDRSKGSPFPDRLAEGMRNQRLSPKELAALQLDRLRRILTHARETTPYYQRTLPEAVERIDALSDLRRAPFITKNDLFENRELMRSTRPKGQIFSGSTSGSTGIASKFYFDSEHSTWVEVIRWRGRSWWGLSRGDSQLVLWSRPVEGSQWVELTTWAKYRLRNCIQFDTFKDFDDAKLEKVYRAIIRERPRIIYSYGSSLGKLADYFDRKGYELRGAQRPKMVEFTADHMFESEQQIGARVFGTRVCPAYGSSEVGGVSQMCREGRLHISTDHVVVETVREDGELVAPGETAQLVLTTLNNFGAPLIRFKVGDLGAIFDEPCRCGLPFPTMKLVSGKAADLITTSEKEAVSAHLLDYINLHLMKHGIRGVKQFLVEQTAKDAFRLTMVKDQPFDERAPEIFAAKMREYLGERIAITTTYVGEIPLQTTGKRRYFKKVF